MLVSFVRGRLKSLPQMMSWMQQLQPVPRPKQKPKQKQKRKPKPLQRGVAEVGEVAPRGAGQGQLLHVLLGMLQSVFEAILFVTLKLSCGVSPLNFRVWVQL